LATAIETLWRQLGGPAACRDAADIDAATQYLLALRRTGEADLGLDSVRLQGLAEKLRDRGGADGDNPVEILTIHHAKGLEWDVVFVPGLGRVPRGDNPPLLRWLQLPAPQAESDLLLAVRSIGEASSSDPLGRFIKQLQAERQDNERVRLAYVAVTRARRRLYLSGHAPFKNKEQARVPRTRSQLHILWPALRQHFEHVVLPSKPVATDAEVTTAGTAIAITAPWYRLPADFSPVQTRRLPQVLGLTSSSTEPASAPEFNWVGPLARAAGTVVHAELERLAATTQPLDTNFTARTAAYATRLRELGVAETQASDMAQVIARQMQQLVRDPHARWLLATEHRGACSELRLSGIVAGELRNVVIDRSFVDTDGVRWVIDYKTSSHKGGGLEEFLESELLRYRPQLQLYVALAQRLGPEPVRAALYFPWLGELREMRIT
jgi:ATP-dependent exoDNAse (exonuclease V) beta subunit